MTQDLLPEQVTGPLTDAELRAAAVPVSAASLPLPSGAATSALQGGGLPAALGAGGGLKIDGSGTAVDVNLATALASATDSVGVEGKIAHDAPDSGNPAKIGGKALSAGPSAVADADRVDAHFNVMGALAVQAPQYAATAGSDGVASLIGFSWRSATNVTSVVPTHVGPSAFNGTSWDRVRNNVEATLLASAERTATTSSSDQTNYNGRGCTVVVNFTVETDAGVSFTAKIEGKDALSGVYYTILESAAITEIGTTVLTVFPGAVAVANLVANALLPRVWRVTCTPADTKRATYSVGSVTNV